MKTIGFIGLGTMGKPMAATLLSKGYSVIVYNRTAEKAQDLVRQGADLAETPAEAARNADVLITMLSNDEVLLDVFYGEHGIMHGVRPGLTVIDCSTVSPDASRKLHRELAQHYADFLDAPVSGGPVAAENGTLLFMVGGSHSVLNEQLPLFEAMGSKVLYMGPSGAGSTAKLAHNTIVGINAIGLIEGMSIAAKANLDVQQFLQVVMAGAAHSKQADLRGQKIIDRDFSNMFSLQLMLKDLLLAGSLTDTLKLPAPLLKSATGVFQMGLSRGLGENDLNAVVQCYEEWMHTKITASQPLAEEDIPETVNPSPSARERRRNQRVLMNIKLLLSLYEWEQEGAFSGQHIEGTLFDLSEGGLQIVSNYPLTLDMFVVIHFPQEAELPPIIGRIIRITPDQNGFRYGCMLSGIPPYVRIKLEEYIRHKLETGTPTT